MSQFKLCMLRACRQTEKRRCHMWHVLLSRRKEKKGEVGHDIFERKGAEQETRGGRATCLRKRAPKVKNGRGNHCLFSCRMWIADEGVAAEMHTFFGIEGRYVSSYASPRLQPSLPASLESTL